MTLTPEQLAELERLEKMCREEGFTELADFFRAKGRNALPSLLADYKRMREALEEIEGGWVGDDIPEEDDEAFVVALQNIARAALKKETP